MYPQNVYRVAAMDEQPMRGEEALGDERSPDRLKEPRNGNRHVIATFNDVSKARLAARQLTGDKGCSSVRLLIRKKGPVAEGESPEEFDDMDVKWTQGAVAGAIKGAAIGAVVGLAIALALWLSNAASVGMSFALAVPIAAAFGAWALGIVGAFGKTWDMSYRDAAMDGQAVVTMDTKDGKAADTAFSVLLDTDAEVVEEFDGGERVRLETGNR
jgi:hypothetical protein